MSQIDKNGETLFYELIAYNQRFFLVHKNKF